ncbi:hypothetical protein ACQ86G_13010 [Roseateles chitinivorans]|uniref:hypothetical protein n=1 Tax=Roseateles chitinivorans TaxID=2917965 RepID=UPI003D66ADBC
MNHHTEAMGHTGDAHSQELAMPTSPPPCPRLELAIDDLGDSGQDDQLAPSSPWTPNSSGSVSSSC